jgi:hypothetical protein
MEEKNGWERSKIYEENKINIESHFMSSCQTNESGIDRIEQYRREDYSTLQNRSKYN